MISSEDNGSLLALVVGVIVVVFAGLGLSVLLDRKYASSERGNELVDQLESGAEEIEMMRFRIQNLEKSALRLASDRAALVTANSEQSTLQDARDRLLVSRGNLRTSLEALQKQFADYREDYRGQTWAAATGASLGDLEVRGGRVYRNAVVTRVTDVGLEIRHRDGLARVHAPELPASYQEKFQWDDEARRARLELERNSREAMATAQKLPEEPEPKVVRGERRTWKQTRGDAVPEELATARRNFVAWKSKVTQLRAQVEHSSTVAKLGGSASVPGSLETWQSKFGRLQKQLAKAEGELAKARLSLAGISPNDPLLKQGNRASF